MKNSRSQKNILLINPWIYDFAAYDLWIKPLGLLYIGAALRRNGYRIQLIDCLDRNHPGMRGIEKSGDRKPDGRGNFHREIVEKPEILNWVPRHFARYGYTEDVFRNELENIEPPDAILITSVMTYWYKGVEAVIERVKSVYPDAPILLGGVYATLCESHARKMEGVAQVIAGYGEEKSVQWLDEYFGINEQYIPGDPEGDPELPWNLYPDPTAIVTLTARGCPYRCTFCATHKLNEQFSQRHPESVINEILQHTNRCNADDVVFYDDALFIRKRKHIEVILDHIIDADTGLRFHTPNGLFAKMIDRQLAEKMVAANFHTVRLSFETSNEGRRKDMSYKVSNNAFLEAMDHLETAGFPRHRVEVYTLMGLPGQTEREVYDSINFVHNAGAHVNLASFTPIPGTVDFQRSVEKYDIDPDTDPLLWNNTIYPLRNEAMDYSDYNAIRTYAKNLNSQLSVEVYG